MLFFMSWFIFIHRNHDQKFYNKLTVLMPDWKQRKAILDEEIVYCIKKGIKMHIKRILVKI